jgi:hypothetical protein
MNVGAAHRPRILATIPGLASLALAVVAALLAPAAQAAPTPYPVCIELGGQAGPDVAHNVAVWTDNRNGNLDIYGRNLAAKTDLTICTNAADQDNPAVGAVLAGGKWTYVAVWVDRRNHPTGDATDIYARDLTAGKTFPVARSATTKWFPDICGDWVVWIEASTGAGPYRIRARNIATGKGYTLASTGVLSPLAVSSRTVGTATRTTVVYASGRGNISGRDLPAGTPFSISRRDTFEWSPDISGNRVVWWEEGGRVMLKNLSSGKRVFVHNGARPRIDGSLVTWDNGGSGGGFTITYNAGADVFVRDVTRSAVTRISQSAQTLLFPAVAGKRVVWEAGPATRVLSHIHIYGADLP